MKKADHTCNTQKAQTKDNESQPRSTNKVLHQERHVTSHHRSMSADFCRRSSTSVITVRKRMKEPQPPPRRASLVNNLLTSHPTSKRYSCPPIGICHALSSSSSSSSSSCSSPPPVQTCTITGHDPLGWKLRPKSSCPRSNRLSLQIPLPVPDQASTRCMATSQSEPLTQPKPLRRYNSDSSALLRCTAMPLPVKTVDEFHQVGLRPVARLNHYDDVFSSKKEDENPGIAVRAKVAKVPPQVPYKSPMARHIAQLMADAHRQDLYSCVKKMNLKPDQSKKKV
ncbi:uncharacterized protein LOC128750199 [Synchiropus splendidus]|uniref:uncharacterized protein LOC128750199 n=1 Tax=Synchiropus splendidus TaxID=270530 RepID=UPI00237DAACE|nr:uncharacterized protein LOC128750199 [Synchiropus splendidus]